MTRLPRAGHPPRRRLASSPRRRLAASAAALSTFAVLAGAFPAAAQRTTKPALHARHWIAITGKPLAATAGSLMFQQGGNAVDAACAMLAATSTMFDALSWGGETQALIFVPETGKVVGINALGVAPTGATPAFFRDQGMPFPPEYGPLAAVTPGTPGGLMVMAAEYGRLSLAEILAPAIDLADGYPIEPPAAWSIERSKKEIKKWPASRELFLPHLGEPWEAPRPGEIFRQPDLAATLRKLVAAEAEALAAGKGRRDAIYAAYERFYRGDIARDLVAGTRAEGGLFTVDDLASWQVYVEEPVKTTYEGVEVYKLTSWVQGPVMLQALNMLSEIDLPSRGYNTTAYIHGLYQVMSLAFADRDFYYGDPYFPPSEPLAGLLSRDYARSRVAGIDWERNDPDIAPGDPYPFQGEKNPWLHLLEEWDPTALPEGIEDGWETAERRSFEEGFLAGTTSIQAADEEGWVVSVTPSGGWIPAFIAGSTGIGLSQRMQSFVLDERLNPFNVLEPGKRPRATLTPALALEGGRPLLSFAVQGGDTQDQNLLQFFLNVVEFGMTAQEAVEAANINSFQMRSSFDAHESRPGAILVHATTPVHVRRQLLEMGYRVSVAERTSGPITAIHFDRETGTMWGAASDYGEDYGISW